jgi:hypothetical protein
MGEIKVEVGQYWEINKGPLKASFSVVIHPEGLKILDCKHFEKDDQTWISFPQKEIKGKDGGKDYLPLISYLNKDYAAEIKAKIVEALKNRKPKESYGKKNSETPAPKTTKMESEPQDIWG